MTAAPTISRALAGQVATGSRGAVAAQVPAGANAGVEILAQGGNVIDAAVATAFACMVADVGRTSIGGYGGHFVYHEAATGTTWLVDFPSRAPAAAHESMFAKQVEYGEGSGTFGGWWTVEGGANQTGPLAVGVPAAVAGLGEAHRRFGTLPWAQVVAPAIRLAEEGIRMPISARDPVLVERERGGRFPETVRVFFDAWDGEFLQQPDLGRSLRTIAAEGPSAMYSGVLGRAIVDHVRSLGGILDYADLEDYEASVTRALAVPYRSYELRSAGLGSGAGALFPIMRALEQFPLGEMDPLGAERMDLLAAVSGVVWPDRLARAAATEDGMAAAAYLLSAEYAAEAAMRVRAGEGRGRKRASGPDGCTNHFSVMDTAGNVVAGTTTLQMLMGSTVTVPGTGIVLNNAMGLFDPTPRLPNSIGPGKTTLTNMCPTIVFKDGQPVLTTGASGGRRIPSMLSQALTLALDHGWPMDQALAAPRFHHEGSGRLLLEDRLPEQAQEQLRQIGYMLDVRPWHGNDLGGQAPAVWFQDGRVVATPDPRRHGGAAAC